MDGSWPLVIGAIYSFICFIGMFFLPAPGAYLPQVDDKTVNASEEGVQIENIDKSLNATSVLDEF